MQSGTHNKAGTTTLCTVALLLTTAIPSYSGAITDSFQSVVNQVTDQEFICEGYDVVELFRAETIEDLEASLTDGYPMPWLEEILKDTTIPWEDRYWLDCRVRAVFAQDLHLFFDRNGNRISVEADLIIPGEDYWREHLMVNPPGESDVADNLRPTTVYADPGYILDRFGNQVGELAEVFSFVTLSRDASIAAVISGGRNACFMYPDGSFLEIPLPRPGGYESIVSANGEVIAFECVSPSGTRDPYTLEPTGITGEVYFFNPSGDLIGNADPYSIIGADERGKLSSDGRLFCDKLSTGELLLCRTGMDDQSSLVGMTEGGRGRTSFSFSPDGQFLCAAGFSTGIVIDLNTDQVTWQSNNTLLAVNDMCRVNCSNRAGCIACVTCHGPYTECYFELEVFIDNQLIYRNVAEESYNEETVVSPNGYFILSQEDDLTIKESGIPTVIRQIRREGSE